MNIPFHVNPLETPAHVDLLRSLELLEIQGFQGTDTSLETSLGDYGICWRYLPNGEVLFVYAVNDHEHVTYARTTLSPAMNICQEFAWAVKEHPALLEFCSYLGVSSSEWEEAPFPLKIADLVSYYGPIEIFGDHYGNSFSIEGVESF